MAKGFKTGGRTKIYSSNTISKNIMVAAERNSFNNWLNEINAADTDNDGYAVLSASSNGVFIPGMQTSWHGSVMQSNPGQVYLFAIYLASGNDEAAPEILTLSSQPLYFTGSTISIGVGNLSDTDGDVAPDFIDNCPNVINFNQLDTDDDGQGNACDPDDDNDGVDDISDAFPLDDTETTDTDTDGIGDNSDNCPNIPNPGQQDYLNDGIGNECDDDHDDDGYENGNDDFPWNPNEFNDSDSDGVGDNSDNCIHTANNDQIDNDGDGVGDVCEDDADGDSIPDDNDNCVNIPNQSQQNYDSDEFGDLCDNDIDGDGIDNEYDAFPEASGEWLDSDGDGVGDNSDNCPTIINTNQQNIDGDYYGDDCDSDIDGDGWSNSFETHFNFDPNIPDNIDLQSFQSLLVSLDQTLTDAASEEASINYGRETDTDEDGISDALEIVLGGDPNDANDSGLLNQIKDYVVNSIGKSVPAMSGIGLLALGLSMLGLGAVRLRK